MLALIGVLIGALLALMVAELVLRRFRPLTDPYASEKMAGRSSHLYVPRVYPPNYSLEIRVVGIPKLPERGRLTANSLGMRTPEFSRTKAPGCLRIVLVGGSALECWHLGDDVTIRALLERELRERTGRAVEVIFAGAWAARSYDYLASLAHRVFHLEPDLVVLAGALGDAFEELVGRDYLMPELPARGPTRSTRRLLLYVATELQLGRAVHRLLKPPRQVADIVTFTADELLYWYRKPPRHGAYVPDPNRLTARAYRENLRSAVGMARGHGVRLILATQPTLFGCERPELGPDPWFAIGDLTFPRSEVAQAIERYNDAVRDVAAELDAPLCDLSASFDGDVSCFYDDFHYGSVGAARTAEALADFIIAEALGTLSFAPLDMSSPKARHARPDY